MEHRLSEGSVGRQQKESRMSSTNVDVEHYIGLNHLQDKPSTGNSARMVLQPGYRALPRS